MLKTGNHFAKIVSFFRSLTANKNNENEMLVWVETKDGILSLPCKSQLTFEFPFRKERAA